MPKDPNKIARKRLKRKAIAKRHLEHFRGPQIRGKILANKAFRSAKATIKARKNKAY